MKAHAQSKSHAQSAKQVSPYSAPLYVLMLLLAGTVVKFGAAIHCIAP